MEQLNLGDVNNPWSALAFIASVAIITLAGWLTMKTKRSADKDAEQAAPVLEAAQAAADLRPAVAALSTQLADVQQEVACMTPIVRVKYPLALDHISALHSAEPELTKRYPIPRPLREDMDA